MNRHGPDDLPMRFDEREAPRSTGLVLQQARHLLAKERVDEAARLFLSVAETVLDAGFLDVARNLLDELRQHIVVDALPATIRAQMFEVEGGVLSRSGQREEARAMFTQLRLLGEQIPDRQITATADHNLANQAFYLDELDVAAQLYRASFQAYLDVGNYYQATRAVLSLVAVAQEQGDFVKAEATIDVAEDFLRYMRKVPMLRFAWALARGQIAAVRHDFSTALRFFHRALRYARQAGDQAAEATTLQNLGAAYTNSGDHRAAIRWFRRGLHLAERLGLVLERAQLCEGLANAYIGAGRRRDAMAYYEQARELYVRAGNRSHTATTTANLGALLVEVGEALRGRQLLMDALVTFREQGDREWEARVLHNLVEAAYRLGDPAQADEVAREVAAVLPPEAHDERVAVFRRAAAAWLAERPPDIVRARAAYEQSLTENDSHVTAWAAEAAGVAATLAHYGGYEHAIDFYTRALEIYEAAGEREMAFHIRNDRAIALTDLERFEEARHEYKACLEIAAALENRAMELQAAFNLGEMAQRERKFEEAIDHLLHAIDLARALDDQDAEVDALGSLGIAYLKAERYAEAADVFHRARDLAQRIRKPTAEAAAIGGLAGIAFAGGHYRTAVRLYRRAVVLYDAAGDWRHSAEDLGALVESLSALGQLEETEREAQRLVDLAQQTHLAPHAPKSLARSARWWLGRGEIEDAADLYALAMALAIQTVGSDEESAVNALAQIVMYPVMHVRLEHVVDVDAFYATLQSRLDKLADRLGETLDPIIGAVRRVVESGDRAEVRDDRRS